MNHWNDLPRLVRERAPKIIQRALNVLIIGAPTPKVARPAPLPDRNTDAINAYFQSQAEIDPEDDWDLVPDIPTAVDAEYYDSAEGEEYHEEDVGYNGQEHWDDSGDRGTNDGVEDEVQLGGQDDLVGGQDDLLGARTRSRPSLGDEEE